jgi:hemoglobin
MDKWMADPTLNANPAVATWHAKAQRCGFKFLVVQIMGQLTGGPQQYTGRPMDEAHKHLNISGDEWQCFMDIFNNVCEEFQLSDELTGDLNALMYSMEWDCVVQPGERVPANPGPAQPRGNSLYARIGGVYPIALFVDRLVDALLQNEEVKIPCDGRKRNDVSLKYLFTELICSVAGGPEVVTARNFDETMLLLPKAAWEIFIAMATIAADHLPVSARAELIQCLQRSKIQIVDPNDDGTALPGDSSGRHTVIVKSLQTAASGRMLSSAAIAARHAAPGAHVDARRRVMGDPRTLYGRGGGVFGLAKLADSLMEAWMGDPVLNENAAVAKWHQSQQKSGFKFLVTQLLGYVTGGPQRYTGVPMEVAHKHLAISSTQWHRFMVDAEAVFQTFGVDSSTQSELLGILASFQDQCVVQPGQSVPEDPGRCRAAPPGNTPYAQLGGVYPLALFAERLVDKVLQGDRVQVQYDHETRHPPGLKYMVTELLCHAAGGPELPTSKGFDAAKLGVDPNQWPQFLEIVAETAGMWPTTHHKRLISEICQQSKVEICFGLEGQSMPSFDAATPAVGMDATVPHPQCPVSGHSGGKCPFSGHSGGKCPFSAGSQTQPGSSDGPAKESVPTPLRKHVKTAWQCIRQSIIGNASSSPSPIGSNPEQVMNETIQSTMTGRILGSTLQQKLDELTDEDPDLCCPVSLMVFREPVLASDGFIYERSSLIQLLQNRQASPMTREILKQEYRAASQKEVEVRNFRKHRSQELLDFVAEAVSGQQENLALTALERVGEYVEGLGLDDQRTIGKKALAISGRLGVSAPAPLLSLSNRTA